MPAESPAVTAAYISNGHAALQGTRQGHRDAVLVLRHDGVQELLNTIPTVTETLELIRTREGFVTLLHKLNPNAPMLPSPKDIDLKVVEVPTPIADGMDEEAGQEDEEDQEREHDREVYRRER